MKTRALVASAVFLLALVPVAARSQQQTPAPAPQLPAALAADAMARMKALPQDELSATRRQSAHYVKGNEYNLDAFSPYVSGVGGACIGIGTDQNFTLAAKARSELVFIMDYDAVVVRLMRVEVAVIHEAETPEAFIALFDEPADIDKVAVLIQRAYGQDPQVAEYLRVYKRYRKEVAEHFVSNRDKGLAGKRIYWLANQDDYGYVRRLVRAGRVAVLDGDLLKGKAVSGIAQLLTSLGTSARIVYLSNAEEYWSRYTTEFEESFTALGLSSESIVLRTFHDTKLPKHPTQNYYHYNVQRGDHFTAWLGKPGRVRYREMMRGVELIGKGYISRLGFPPD